MSRLGKTADGKERPQRGCHGLAIHDGRLRRLKSAQRPPLIATKSPKRKTPLESARAGAEDDSSADNLVTDPGMNTTTNQIIGTNQVTPAAGQECQVCSCGCSKVTSIRGLRIADEMLEEREAGTSH